MTKRRKPKRVEGFSIKLTPAGASALTTYVLDSTAEDETFPGYVKGGKLVVTGNLEEAWQILTEASDLAASDGGHVLAQLAGRCLQEHYRRGAEQW